MKLFITVILSTLSAFIFAADGELTSNILCTYPEIFSREPFCDPNTICISEQLNLQSEDYTYICEIAYSENIFDGSEVKEIRNVMSDIVHVIIGPSNPRQRYGNGTELLLEKTSSGWEVLKKESWRE